MPGPEGQDTYVAELLADFVDRARLAIALAAGVIVLVIAGAKLERYLMKRQLQVLDGAQDLDLTEDAGGDRR